MEQINSNGSLAYHPAVDVHVEAHAALHGRFCCRTNHIRIKQSIILFYEKLTCS